MPYNLSMKIVKTHKGWKLHQLGFPVAIRFDNYNKEVAEVEQWLRANMGSEFLYSSGRWKSHWGRGSYTMSPDGYSKEWNRPYFIGFKDEAEITLVMLATGDFINNA